MCLFINLDNIVNKCNNTYHSKIKMKNVDDLTNRSEEVFVTKKVAPCY